MAEIEKETITAKFKGAIDEGKRRVYTFENAKDPLHDLKFSAFQPNMPDLVMGKLYEMTVEHVPMSDGSGKKYHNFGRATRDGPYLVKEAAVQSTLKENPCQPMPSAKQADPKENYWDTKTTQDIKRNAIIVREAVLNSAIAYHQAIGVSRTTPPTVDNIIDTATCFEKWVKEAKV